MNEYLLPTPLSALDNPPDCGRLLWTVPKRLHIMPFFVNFFFLQNVDLYKKNTNMLQ